MPWGWGGRGWGGRGWRGWGRGWCWWFFWGPLSTAWWHPWTYYTPYMRWTPYYPYPYYTWW